MVSLRLQFITFFNMIVIGMGLAIIFDLYRILRGKTDLNNIIIDIFDIIFSLMSALILFVGLVYSNGGKVRYYIFGGVIIGVFIYYLLFSKFFIKIFIKIFNIIRLIYNKLKNIGLIFYKRLKSIIIKIRDRISF